MIAVVQNNACNAEDMVILKQRLHKYGMFVKLFPNQVQQNIMHFWCRFRLEFTTSPL